MAFENTGTVAARGGTVAECPPVLLIWFNRPDLAARVLDRVRLARPARLYIAVDGARSDGRHPQDAGLVRSCRDLAAKVDGHRLHLRLLEADDVVAGEPAEEAASRQQGDSDEREEESAFHDSAMIRRTLGKLPQLHVPFDGTHCFA